MMLILNDDSKLHCEHKTGSVKNRPSQGWVRIAGKAVLVKPDPIGCSISGCSNVNLVSGINPCTTTVTLQAGDSGLVKIDGLPVCLDTVKGLTNGAPAGSVSYTVSSPGQTFIRAAQ